MMREALLLEAFAAPLVATRAPAGSFRFTDTLVRPKGRSIPAASHASRLDPKLAPVSGAPSDPP
jgi:hypothetical protein